MAPPTPSSSRLIGLWSADARYGPGAQSDDLVWFEPDGRGRIDFVNFVLCTVTFFDWSEISPGLLGVTMTRTLQWSDGVEEELHPTRVEEYPFSIGEELCPNSQMLEVLRIDLAAHAEGAFARAHHRPDDFDSPHLGR